MGHRAAFSTTPASARIAGVFRFRPENRLKSTFFERCDALESTLHREIRPISKF
jgi:hypothetical protein